MELVIDANILFAALIRQGKTEELMLHHQVRLFSPGFLLDEFQKYESLILKKTSRDHSGFQELMGILKRRITLVPDRDIKPHLKEAEAISPDRKDVKYFAVALKKGCGIWSNDKRLRSQGKVRIYATEELVMIFSL